MQVDGATNGLPINTQKIMEHILSQEHVKSKCWYLANDIGIENEMKNACQ